MAWSTIAADEVLQEFTPQEKAALETIQGASTQLAAILARVVNSARGNILAGGNVLDATASTIPDQLRTEIIALARWKWLTSFPQLKSLQTDARKQAADDAQALLQLIASRKPERPRVEQPDGTSPVGGVTLLGSHDDAHPFDDLGTT